MMDRENLKNLAIALEKEMKNCAENSLEVARLSEYQPLARAIERAKKMEIEKPEGLPGISWWLSETNIRSFRSLELAINNFCWFLEGLDKQYPDAQG
jgi:hypothetical protein